MSLNHCYCELFVQEIGEQTPQNLSNKNHDIKDTAPIKKNPYGID